jgi:hypothetical protein
MLAQKAIKTKDSDVQFAESPSFEIFKARNRYAETFAGFTETSEEPIEDLRPTKRFLNNFDENEYDKLIVEQAQIASKILTGEATKKETLKLQLIRWTIDRLDRARYFSVETSLEAYVKLHEELAIQINKLVDLSERQRNRPR